DTGIGSIIVQMANDDWGILTRRDVVKKIIAANKSPARVRAGDIATSPLITVDRDESLHKVAELLMQHNIRRVVVLDEHGQPEGIVSENGLFRNVEEFGWAAED
ncbi:MAG: CBS domain-containing protein, partial [Candidatus Competibacterales bacterium]|nr:CBS domain-containing protein [Candidatus Competibacterales bacterium]